MKKPEEIRGNYATATLDDGTPIRGCAIENEGQPTLIIWRSGQKLPDKIPNATIHQRAAIAA